jgi:magnesium transporter
MNFKHMPELNWMIGYPLSLAAMAAVSMVIFLVLKKKKWL